MKIIRRSKNGFFMEMARICAEQGTCLRRNSGSVLVDPDNFVISTGYTGSPKGVPHCEECMRNKYNIPSGSNYEKCKSVHSEMNALIQAGKNAKGSRLFLYSVDINTGETLSDYLPCLLCAKMLINAEVEMVYYMSNGVIAYDTPSNIFYKRWNEAWENKG